MTSIAEAAKEETEEKPDFFTAVKEIGSIVEFGTYEQDNDLDNGPETIEWIVLDVQDGKSLLISKYGLDGMPYHAQDGFIYWKNCSLRSWLYNEFLKLAFTEAEQKSILVTTVDNSTKQRFSEPGSNAESDTQERVFLLGYDEVEKYKARQCEPTAYALARGTYTDYNGACSWWLRTPGFKQTADSVLADGSVGSQRSLSQGNIAVRPAIWISNAVKAEDRESVEAERERVKAERLQKLREKGIIGLEVSFGSYEQDNDLSNGPEPIEWTILDVQGGKALLISKYGLDCQPYDTAREDVTWETCTLRSWLNEDFLNTAFPDTEKKRIFLTSVDNRDSQGKSNWKSGGNNSEDQIFLLSYAEARDYFVSAVDRACPPTEYAVSQGVIRDAKSGNCRWWLRSPGSNQLNAAFVDSYGSIGNNFVYIGSDAVRPAFWINLESDLF